MDLSNIPQVLCAVVITGAVFYLLGRLLGKYWWLTAIPLAVVLAVSLVYINTAAATSCSLVSSESDSCLGGAIIVFVVFLVAMASGIGLVLGMPMAYIGSRRKRRMAALSSKPPKRLV